MATNQGDDDSFDEYRGCMLAWPALGITLLGVVSVTLFSGAFDWRQEWWVFLVFLVVGGLSVVGFDSLLSKQKIARGKIPLDSEPAGRARWISIAGAFWALAFLGGAVAAGAWSHDEVREHHARVVVEQASSKSDGTFDHQLRDCVALEGQREICSFSDDRPHAPGQTLFLHREDGVVQPAVIDAEPHVLTIFFLVGFGLVTFTVLRRIRLIRRHERVRALAGGA